MVQFTTFLSLVAGRVLLCSAQLPHPTETSAPDAVVHAIVPTASGQIGINTVDLPKPEDVQAGIGKDTDVLQETVSGSQTSTKWIGARSDFGVATIVRGSKPTQVPQGFRVTKGDDGLIEITRSQWLKEKMDAVMAEMPAEIKQRAILKPRVDRFVTRHTPKSPWTGAPFVSEGTRRRVGWSARQFGNQPWFMEQANELNNQVVPFASGTDAGQLATNRQMIRVGISEEAAEAVIAEAEEALLAQAAAEAAAVAVEAVGIFATVVVMTNILTDMWKWKAEPQPMPIWEKHGGVPGAGSPNPDKDGCPLYREWKGCKCLRSARETAFVFPIPNWPTVLQTVMNFSPGPSHDTPAEIPNPKCDTTQPKSMVNFESRDWTR
ncbi:hypothetical protein PG996_014376 [Apiospora saccharicola]|uniref:Uncharacterized protein n=1 Tax=Apiospora saccharicola TaxID=335842 RepID=A0ABR1TIW0_9PEZI